MVVSQYLSADGPPFSDHTLYRSLVGALQYLTSMWLDIDHVVNSVSQFLYVPTSYHFLAIKYICCYVKGTLYFGITFHLSAMVAYSYACWASCFDTHHFISGYSIYLGENLVSWSVKK